jgi:hypothetical protein
MLYLGSPKKYIHLKTPTRATRWIYEGSSIKGCYTKNQKFLYNRHKHLENEIKIKFHLNTIQKHFILWDKFNKSGEILLYWKLPSISYKKWKKT